VRDELQAGAAEAARRLRLDVDREAYAAARRDPREPILCAGNPDARVCVIGRDLGRDEVMHGAPLVGPSGRAVRAAVLEAVGEPPVPDDPLLERALHHVLLTNTVPFKPRENRPFPARVREAFRPWIERLLVCRFRGDWVLALGNDAFAWFMRYADAGRSRDRFRGALRCRIAAPCERDRLVARELRVCLLPHPSPANARYVKQFPALIGRRLREARLCG
jgi:uracil-DNA glycosylase family 4